MAHLRERGALEFDLLGRALLEAEVEDKTSWVNPEVGAHRRALACEQSS